MKLAINIEQVKAALTVENIGIIEPETMLVLVEGVKRKQHAKKRAFHCEVICASGVLSESDLYHFFVNLSYKSASRRHILIKRRNHWTAMELMVIDGKINVYLFDAANSLPHVLEIIYLLNHTHPTAIIYYSGATTQRDRHNCAFFSLHNILSLSKIKNLFSILPTITNRRRIGMYKNYADYIYQISNEIKLIDIKFNQVNEISSLINYIPITNFPCQFGSLVQNYQNLLDLEHLNPTKKFIRTIKNKPVDCFIKAHTEENRNMVILHTKDKLITDALALIEQEAEVEDATFIVSKNSRVRQQYYAKHCFFLGTSVLAGVGLSAVILGSLLFIGTISLGSSAVVGLTLGLAALTIAALTLTTCGVYNTIQENRQSLFSA